MSSNDLTALRQAFYCERRFYDDEKFPRGFGRSGNFTLIETEILEQHGYLLKNLYQKVVEPQNEMQAHFVAATHGEAEAVNPMEKAWIKYLRLTTSKARFFTVFGKSRGAGTPEVEFSTQEDDY